MGPLGRHQRERNGQGVGGPSSSVVIGTNNGKKIATKAQQAVIDLSVDSDKENDGDALVARPVKKLPRRKSPAVDDAMDVDIDLTGEPESDYEPAPISRKRTGKQQHRVKRRRVDSDDESDAEGIAASTVIELSSDDEDRTVADVVRHDDERDIMKLSSDNEDYDEELDGIAEGEDEDDESEDDFNSPHKEVKHLDEGILYGDAESREQVELQRRDAQENDTFADDQDIEDWESDPGDLWGNEDKLDETIIHFDKKSQGQLQAQRREQRLEKRAEQRRKDSAAYQQHRMEYWKESLEINLPFIRELLRSRLQAYRDRQEAETTAWEYRQQMHMTKLQTLKHLVAVNYNLRSLPIPPDDDPTWTFFSERVLDFLFTIREHPFDRGKWQPFVDDGTVAIITQDELFNKVTGFVKYYVRSGPIDVSSTKTNSLVRYSTHFLADIPFALYSARQLHVPLDLIEDELSTTLEALDLVELKTTILDAIGDFIKNPPPSFLPVVDKPNTLYIGETIAGTPDSRVQQDLESVRRRICNYQSVNGQLSTVYHIQAIAVPANDALDARRKPYIGIIEDIIMQMARGVSLNAPTRGIVTKYQESEADRTVIDSALGFTADYADTIKPLQPDILDSIKGLVVDQKRRLHALRPQDERIHPDAFTSVLATCGDSLGEVNGEVVSVTVGKDITGEEFKGIVPGFWSETAGQSPRQIREIHAIIDPRIPTHGSVPIPVIRSCLFPFIDFFCLTLCHLLIYLHALFLSRYLLAVKPVFIVIASKPIASFISSGGLEAAWSFTDDSELHERFRSNRYSIRDLQELVPAHKERDHIPLTWRGGQFLDEVAVNRIVKIGPGEGDLAIAMPIRDDGANKYDPGLSELRLRLQLLSHTLAIITRRVTATQLQDSPPLRSEPAQFRRYLESIIDDVNSISNASGLRAAIDDAKTQLRCHEAAVASLRSHNRALLDYHNGVKVDQEAMRPYAPHQRPHRPKPVVYKSEESAASAARNRAELGKRSHEGAVERARLDADGTSFRSRLESENIRLMALHAIVQMLEWVELGEPPFIVPALKDDGRNMTPQLRRADPWDTDGQWSLRERWRFFNCPTCKSWPIAANHNSDHLCLDGKVVTMNEEFLLDKDSLKTLLYPQCIFNDPNLSTIIVDTPEKLGFNSFSARTVLSDNPKILPEFVDISVVDRTVMVYLPKTVKPTSMKGKAILFTYAVDVLLQAVCRSVPFPKEKAYAFGECNKQVASAFVDGKNLYVASCTKGYFALINTDRPSQHKHDGDDKRGRCSEADAQGVANIFGLPVNSARRVWFGERVQGVWSGTLEWTRTVKVKKKRPRKPKGG